MSPSKKQILFATLRHPTFKCTHYKIQYQSGKHSTRRTVFLPITRMGLLSSILFWCLTHGIFFYVCKWIFAAVSLDKWVWQETQCSKMVNMRQLRKIETRKILNWVVWMDTNGELYSDEEMSFSLCCTESKHLYYVV